MTVPARRWMGVAEAAALLGLDPTTIRRGCERNARRAPDGGVEAHFEGVHGRKFGRTWRVCLAPAWLAPLEK